MVAEMQNLPSVAANGQQLWLRESIEIDLARFDLAYKDSVGRLYLLDPNAAKAIANAIGFTARFEHNNVQSASFDIWQEESTITFAMAKNTKPIDVGLRYMADRWRPSEQANKRQLSGHSMALRYHAKHLPSPVRIAVFKQLGLGTDASDLIHIRVNFKSLVYVLITEKQNEDQLPDGAAHCFSLASAQIPTALSGRPDISKETANPKLSAGQPALEIPSAVREPEVVSMTMLNEPVAKYATYSRSEIDLLLKKQAETIAANFSSKFTNQQKALQEATRVQEQKITKIVDDLQIFCETARKRIEDAEAKRLSGSQSIIEQANKQLASEIEQFKTYLNKQVTPNLKSLEDRIITMVNAIVLSKENKPERDHATTAIALLALLLSLVNLGLTLLKH